MRARKHVLLLLEIIFPVLIEYSHSPLLVPSLLFVNDVEVRVALEMKDAARTDVEKELISYVFFYVGLLGMIYGCLKIEEKCCSISINSYFSPYLRDIC